MSPWLETKDLGFSHRASETVFSNLNLKISGLSPLAICGRSGVGKTTLLNLIAGTLTPTHGALSMFGQAITQPSSERALVFQNHNLFPWLTARANVEFGMRYKGVDRKSRWFSAMSLLGQFGLGDAADRFPHELSGGMRQRVGIARALAVSPACLLLDEPFAALDPATKQQIIQILKEVIDQTDMRVIVVSHDVEDMLEFSKQVLVLDRDRAPSLLQVEDFDRAEARRLIQAEYIHSPTASPIIM